MNFLAKAKVVSLFSCASYTPTISFPLSLSLSLSLRLQLSLKIGNNIFVSSLALVCHGRIPHWYGQTKHYVCEGGKGIKKCGRRKGHTNVRGCVFIERFPFGVASVYVFKN